MSATELGQMQKTKMSKILELRSKNFREVGQGVDSVV